MDEVQKHFERVPASMLGSLVPSVPSGPGVGNAVQRGRAPWGCSVCTGVLETVCLDSGVQLMVSPI